MAGVRTTPTTVVGAGSWGTALAKLLADRGVPTTLWAREAEVVEAIRRERQNVPFLPGFDLGPALTVTDDLEAALAGAEVVVSAVPTQYVRGVFADRLVDVGAAEILVSVSKGIELGTLRTPSEIFAELIPGELVDGIVCLSGPSFAREVAAGHPTAVVGASRDQPRARHVQSLFSGTSFRVYTSDDVISVEYGGALKNIIAIAAGIAEGLGFGHNTVAALITRGVAEITRLGVARGGHPLTFAGLSGMGDLVLTCTGDLSRNRSVGLEIGRGKTLEAILQSMNMVAEGVKTTKAARELAQKVGVEMPITEQVYRILYEDKDPRTVVLELMERNLREEREDRRPRPNDP
jgi:glycerol-3-phosphate dehydrogenase (NAD(P)+)